LSREPFEQASTAQSIKLTISPISLSICGTRKRVFARCRGCAENAPLQKSKNIHRPENTILSLSLFMFKFPQHYQSMEGEIKNGIIEKLVTVLSSFRLS